MLWYKTWLETRLRFFIGMSAIAALCAFYVFFRPTPVGRWNEMLRLHPDWHRPWWIHRAVNEYTFYIWRILFDNSLRYLWVALAVLIGVGGLTQESGKGSAGCTLALPVSRRRMTWTHMAVGCTELTILGLVPAVVLPLLSPFVNGSYSVGEAVCRGLLMAGGGLVIFSFAFAVSTLTESPYAPVIASIAAVVSLGTLLGPYESELKEPLVLRAVDLFRLISGPPDFEWRAFPWTGLLVSLTAALVLALFALRVIDTRDYR